MYSDIHASFMYHIQGDSGGEQAIQLCQTTKDSGSQYAGLGPELLHPADINLQYSNMLNRDYGPISVPFCGKINAC